MRFTKSYMSRFQTPIYDSKETPIKKLIWSHLEMTIYAWSRFQTPIYGSKKTHMCFTNPYKSRFQTRIYNSKKTPIKTLIWSHLEMTIYGWSRLQTPIYGSKKTHMCFTNPYRSRFQTTIYDSKKTPIKQLIWSHLEMTIDAWSRFQTLIYGSKKRICVSLFHIGAVSKRLYMTLRKRLWKQW